MSDSEAVIMKRVMLEASKLGLRMFRNHVGGFYAKDGSFQRTGLCKGSADLIGFDSQMGFFAAIEVKKKGGKLSKEQENFLKRVTESGGFACVCEDEKKLKKMLDNYRVKL